jgi:hypothetical protein
VIERLLGMPPRALYLIEDLDEIAPGALWADSRLGFNLGVRHHKEWVARQSSPTLHWAARATRLFAWMIPARRACSRAPS